MAALGDKECRHAWYLPGKVAEERDIPIAGIVVHMFCLCKRGNGENAGAKVRCTFQVRCTSHPYACTATAVCGEKCAALSKCDALIGTPLRVHTYGCVWGKRALHFHSAVHLAVHPHEYGVKRC